AGSEETICTMCSTPKLFLSVSSLDDAGFAQSGDLSLFVAEFTEHAVGVLPHLVRRVLDRRSAVRKFERGQGHAHRTIDTRYALEMVKDAPILKVRVGDGLRHCADPRRRDMARLKVVLPFVRGLGLDDVSDDRRLALAIIEA